MYKVEGEGFQCDALCQEGFTYQIYMRKDPAQKKYLVKGLSPLHSRILALFDNVKDKYHQCAIDNLYNSAAFVVLSVCHKWKVLCHDVTRKGHRGLPKSVIQEEQKTKKKKLLQRGTVKAAVLRGHKKHVNLVVSSVYDNKPTVHYLSMVW